MLRFLKKLLYDKYTLDGLSRLNLLDGPTILKLLNGFLELSSLDSLLFK